MNYIFLFAFFWNLIRCSLYKKNNQWSDESIPPPTTPTNTPSFPTQMPPLQTWPTEPIAWPPTMSPYPTIVPHIITTGSSKKKSFSKTVIIITVAVLSAVFVAAIVFAIIMIIRRIRANKLRQYNGILNSISESDLAKTE